MKKKTVWILAAAILWLAAFFGVRRAVEVAHARSVDRALGRVIKQMKQGPKGSWALEPEKPTNNVPTEAGIIPSGPMTMRTLEEIPVWRTGSSFDLSEEQQATLVRRAEGGDPESAFRLYLYYSQFKGDRQQGSYWLHLSARLGSLNAQYNYAVDLLESNDPRDNKEGVEWLDAASRRGLTDAQVKLAQTLEAGRGHAVNLEEAREWYERAALSGDLTAMKKMVEFLREGKGGNTDPVLAYAWADLYCTRVKGSVAASMLLPRLEKMKANLSPEELERGNKQSRKLENTVPKEMRD